MTPEHWQRIGDLFTRALAEPAAGRAAWLAASEAPDDVRAEVAALLEAHDASDDDAFLESPPATEVVAASAAAPDPRLVPGAEVGPYRLVRELGRGGMGVVFEAEDTRLHRRVALKAVSAPGLDDSVGQQRLRHEARAAAALVHPNIATIYALEEFEGRAFIVSEYLEGEALRDTIRRGPLALDDALAVALALARALDAAHTRGIVHRDLKPENVLRLPDGRVKVLDFGLARLDGEARPLASVSYLTLQGAAAGTPGYMAPEQLLGLAVDGRADQYALGVLLVEMVTGANPFDGASLAATIARVMQADGLPPLAPGIVLPAGIAAVAQRCTRRRPEDRFASTGELVRVIEAGYQPGPPGPVPGATTPGRADLVASPVANVATTSTIDPATGHRSALWWWRFHQAAAAAVYWLMVVPAWLVHRQVPPGLSWFLGCLAATIIAANVRLHLRFSAAVLPAELPAQRARTRGWVAIADWAILVLWAYAGVALMDSSREWSMVFFAFAIGVALVVGLIEPATTRAAFGGASAPES